MEGLVELVADVVWVVSLLYSGGGGYHGAAGICGRMGIAVGGKTRAMHSSLLSAFPGPHNPPH